MGKKTILVIDDDPTILALIADILADAGYETVIATDGGVAYQVLQWARPDAIVVDLQMPTVTGQEFVLRVRKEAADLPVVVVSSHPNVDKEAAKVGASAYVRKPFDIDMLLTTVTAVVP
ncbi:MAG: response regulator [Chloroflexota bacterium]